MGTSTRTPDFPPVQAFLNGGPAPKFNYHRFRAQVDVALANAELFPTDTLRAEATYSQVGADRLAV